MTIESICAGCGQRLRADQEHRGSTAACPICHREYVIGEVVQADERFPAAPVASPLPTESAPTWNSGATNSVDMSHAPSDRSDDPLRADDVSLASPMFQVMTPDGKVYGPCDEATVYSWIAQNRLNGMCAIRVVGADEWQSIAEWQMRQPSMIETPVLEPLASPLGTAENPSRNPYGTSEGRPSNPYAAPIADTGTIPYPSGPVSSQAGLILGLGLFSFMCNVCGMGIIPAIVVLILASQESKKMAAGVIPSTQKGLVIAGQVLAVITLLFSALQWLLVFVS